MKKSMKKLVAIILTATVALSAGMPAYATEKESVIPIESKKITRETDMYFHWQECTNIELLAEGYSEEEIKEIREFNLEQAFLERAQLSEDELQARGYNSDEIAALKNYNGEVITADSPVLLAAAVCTGNITNGDYAGNNTKISVAYTWSWNHEPLVALTDKAVLAWAAYSGSTSRYVDPISSKSYAKVSLYSAATGNYVRDESLDLNIKKMSKSADAEYSANISGYWVKNGKIHLYLDASQVPVSKVEFSGALGHWTAILAGEISYSLTSGLDIIFSPELKVDNCGTVYAEATTTDSSCVIRVTGH